MEAYHTTSEEYITSIVKFGLIPNYGKNSRSVTDKRRVLFYSTKKGNEHWKNQFHNDKEVTLIFDAENEADYAFTNIEEMFTTRNVPADSIRVRLNDEEISLEDYYNQNREYFDNLFASMVEKKFQEFNSGELDFDALITGMDLLGFMLAYDDANKEAMLKTIRSKIIENLTKNNASQYLSKRFQEIIETNNLGDIFELKADMAQGYDFNPAQQNTLKAVLEAKGRDNKKISFISREILEEGIDKEDVARADAAGKEFEIKENEKDGVKNVK